MTYSQKLLDPRWQKKRLSIFERDGWECKLCGEKESTFHVHHSYYEYGNDPWNYPDYALVTLCSDCHESEHEAMKMAMFELRKAMSQAGLGTSMYVQYLTSFVKDNFKDGAFHG